MKKNSRRRLVGTSLIELRTSRNLTIQNLSTISGIKEKTLEAYERGNSTPTRETLQQLSTALKCSVNELVTTNSNSVLNASRSLCNSQCESIYEDTEYTKFD